MHRSSNHRSFKLSHQYLLDVQVVQTYYTRRLWRLAPAYYAMLVVHSVTWLWEGGQRRNSGDDVNEIVLNLYKDRSALRQAFLQLLCQAYLSICQAYCPRAPWSEGYSKTLTSP